MKLSPIILLMLFATGAHAAPQNDEVEHLLQYLSQSGCRYLRNNSEYTAEEAVAHIRKKYRYYQDEIDSTERFIELSASRSSISGKAYTIRCPGLPAQDSNAWLSKELQRYRGAE